MKNLALIAKPYAKAIFNYALEHDELSFWAGWLANASSLIKSPVLAEIISNPEVSKEILLTVLVDALKTEKQAPAHRLLDLLVMNRRLDCLPYIIADFNRRLAVHEKKLNADVLSTYPLSDKQLADLSMALEKRLQCQVVLTCKVDASLLGGLVIRIGDNVIDGSGRGRLAQLKECLS